MRIEDFTTQPANPNAVIPEPQLVSLADLPATLPSTMVRIAASERTAQLNQREAGYQMRAAH